MLDVELLKSGSGDADAVREISSNGNNTIWRKDNDIPKFSEVVVVRQSYMIGSSLMQT